MRQRKIIVSDRVEIVPSLLSADFSRLASEIRLVEKAGCRMMHLDVMDGHFVPNITIGPVVAAAVRKVADLSLVAHLMIEQPERFLVPFQNSGVDEIIIHQEIRANYIEVLKSIRALGLLAGVSIRPRTPVEAIVGCFDHVDSILIMTVEPGFGGQEFIKGSEKKVAEVRRLLKEHGKEVPIGVDGGINVQTAPLVVKAGATRLIAGSAIFRGDVVENVRRLKKSAEKVRSEK